MAWKIIDVETFSQIQIFYDVASYSSSDIVAGKHIQPSEHWCFSVLTYFEEIFS